MLGLAQKLFIESGGVLPKKSLTRHVTTHSWPLLDKLLQRQCLPYIDYALAEKLLPDADECVAALLCNLSMAVRAGHLCLCVDHDGVLPPLQDLWNDALETIEDQIFNKITDEEMAQLQSLIIQGAAQLPTHLFADVSRENFDINKPLCRLGNLFYMQRYWCDETLLVESFKAISQSKPDFIFDPQLVSQKITALEKANQLLPEQSLAISSASNACFTIVVGGPGTGKTYTAGHMIRTFWETMTPSDRKHCEIALAAPTGKAAANLQKSLKSAIRNYADFPEVKAQTLHALLSIRGAKNRNEPQELLSADIIVVDESSMIDVFMFSRLLAAIKPGARLILLGDPSQLPPVSTGMLFSDLVEYLVRKQSSAVISLKKCMRSELQGIVDFARAVNEGNVTAVEQILDIQSPGIKSVWLKNEESSASIQQKLLKYAAPIFLKAMDTSRGLEHVLEAFNRFRILSPLRRSHLGADALNEMFAQHLLPIGLKSGVFVAPIMIVASDRRLELFNGEVGILVKHMDGQGASSDYALFPGKESESRKVPSVLLPKYEYAYCLTVHKSQGSEFDHVLMLLPEGSEGFGRESLYTAITRARKQIELWQNESVLSKMVSRQSHRMSGIDLRLHT